MYKIAVITPYVALPNEKGYSRFEYISNMIANADYDVDLITSTFQHWEKKQRDISKINISNRSYSVNFIDEPGYVNNIDLKRIISHKKLSQNLKKYLIANGKKYDLIYCLIPDNETAAIAAQYANNNKIPFIVDVGDLWPEAMRMVLDIPIISDIIFHSYIKYAKKVYKLCDAVIGTSDEYRDRPFKDTTRDIPKYTVYVGCDLKEFDSGVFEYQNDIDKKSDELWVSYAGNIGTSYDIKTLILASEQLKNQGYDNIQIMLMGNGPLKENMERLANSIDCNVKFTGYLPYRKMAAYLSKSDILVNSFVKKAPQSIVTKIGDYLAAGKPMINTCGSEEFKNKVDSDGFGINIESENVNTLTEAILYLYNNKAIRSAMGEKARLTAEREFDRPIAYKKILDLIKQLLAVKQNVSI
jgi:glycosyltransferase involved in cell wall biosynthesis